MNKKKLTKALHEAQAETQQVAGIWSARVEEMRRDQLKKEQARVAQLVDAGLLPVELIIDPTFIYEWNSAVVSMKAELPAWVAAKLGASVEVH